MPSAAAARALRAALLAEDPSLALSWQSLEAFDPAREAACLADAQAYLVGVAEPAPSAVTLGGAEDLGELSGLRPRALQQAMLARAAGRQRVVLMLSSPYPASQFAALAETVLASYDGAAPGPAYGALAAVLCGRLAARGRLPVTLPG
jgi:beta-N-acetylhexosaminidase